MLEKLSFEIKESPVLYDRDGQILTSGIHKVLHRSDTGRVLSVMKNSYFPTFNEHFMETTEKLSEISGFELAGYSEINGGAIVMSHLKNTEEDLFIGGHKIEDYLVTGSSCDGKYSWFLGTTTVLTRCTNQFSKLNRFERVRHTASAPRRIEELLKTLEIYFKGRKEMFQNFSRMQDVKIDQEIKDAAIMYLLKLEEQEMLEGKLSTQKLNQAEQVELALSREISDVGDNLWGLFNGMTYYTTHVLKQKEAAFGNLFGQSGKLNKRAYDFSMEQLMLS